MEWVRAHGTWLASRVILAEDVRMLHRCQTRPDSQAVRVQLLHDQEAAALHLHQTLARWKGAVGGVAVAALAISISLRE